MPTKKKTTVCLNTWHLITVMQQNGWLFHDTVKSSKESLPSKKKTKVGLNKHVAALLKKWGWKNNFCEIEIVSNKILPQTASFVQKSQPLPKKSFFFLAKNKIKKPLIFASKKKERRVNRSFLGKIATFCWAKKQNKASQKKKSTPINVVSKKKRRANEQNSCSFFTHHNDFVANRIFQHKTKKASKKTSTKKNTKGDENELTRLLSSSGLKSWHH